LKSEFRQWIIQNKVGLLSKDQLIPLLDLILEPINEDDCKIIARELLTLYKKGELNTQKLGDISHKLYLSLEWGCEAFDKFIWISDEVDLIEQGYKSNSDLETNIEKVLGEVIAL
jgi:hypothetical protein